MSRIWKAVLRWIARAMERLSQILRSWADHIRSKISDPQEVEAALRDPQAETASLESPDSAFDHPDSAPGRREAVGSPPARFRAHAPPGEPANQSKGPPAHWLDDVRRIQSQSASVPREDEAGTSAPDRPSPDLAPAVDRGHTATAAETIDSPDESSPTNAPPSRRTAARVLQTIEELPSNAGGPARSSHAPHVTPPAASQATKPLTLQVAEPQTPQVTPPTAALQRQPVRPIRLLRPTPQHHMTSHDLVSSGSVADQLVQRASEAAVLPAETEPFSLARKVSVPPAPLVVPAEDDAPAIDPPRAQLNSSSASRESAVSELSAAPDLADPPPTQFPQNLSTPFRAVRPTWPELPTASGATYRRTGQKVRTTVDDSPWPDLTEQRGSSLAHVDEVVRLRRQRRAAERIRRLEQEQRGE